jgi:glycosyltransferase involved in cell wall biosynthesis
MSPKITVIMPAYKAAATIAAALGSIRAQTVPVHEVIVVDDGSPDDTAELVARDFPEVRLLRQPNAGPAVARNNGAQAATGDWLAFLDADDVWLADKLERQLPATEDPKVAIVAGRVVGRREPHFNPAPDFDSLWAHNTIPTSSVLLRRAAFCAAGGMAAHLPPCEDYHLWLRLAGTGCRIVVVNAPVVIYSPTDQSLTRNLSRFAEAERVCIEDVGATFRLPRQRIRKRVAVGYHAHGQAALYVRNMKAARRLLMAALRRSPSSRRMIDLVAATMPGAMLDLRRRLLQAGRQGT